MKEVALHNKEDDLWVVVNGDVMDVRFVVFLPVLRPPKPYPFQYVFISLFQLFLVSVRSWPYCGFALDQSIPRRGLDVRFVEHSFCHASHGSAIIIARCFLRSGGAAQFLLKICLY